MDWKENIGKNLSDKNIYRINYLEYNCLESNLKELTNYLNEFFGMQARYEKINYISDTKNLFAASYTRYRLEIFYPKDQFLYGKLCDNKNRRFIIDFYFNEDGLNIWVFYRRFGGSFLNTKYVANEFHSENKKGKSLDIIMKKISDDFQKRDIYKEIMTFNEALNSNILINRIIFLYEKHIENIESFNKK